MKENKHTQKAEITSLNYILDKVEKKHIVGEKEREGNTMKRLIIPVFSTFVLLCLSLIPSTISLDGISPQEPWGAVITTIKYYLYTNKILVAFIFSLLIVYSNIKENMWGSRKTYQAVISNQLKDIMEDCFKTKQAQVRISVFKKADWFEAFIHYMFHISIRVMELKLFPKGFFSSLKGIPIPFSKYLIIFARLGTPSQSVYSTIFRITDDNEKIEGVVGIAWKSHSPVKINLPNISDFEFKKYKELKDIPESPEKTNLEIYMKDGNITYKKLRTIHRHSTSLWAFKLHDPGKEPWGVIVIDSSEKDVVENVEPKKLGWHSYQIKTIINRYYKNL